MNEMNCLIVDDNAIARVLLGEMLKGIEFIRLAGDCEDSLQALAFISKNPVDLLLLDVEMPRMSGIEFLKSLPVKPLAILTTAKTDYVMDAFELNVVDYLVKPVREDRLIKALIKAREVFESRHRSIEKTDRDFIFVREKNALQRIALQDMLYIQALSDYIIIYLNEGRYTVHMTLKAFLEKFSSTRFIRIHRSYIAAVDKIDRIEEGTVFIGKHPVPVGDNYKAELLRRINSV